MNFHCLVIAVVFLIAPVHSADRFAIVENGTAVVDAKTGLTWRRCAEGQIWDIGTASCSGRATVFNHEAALTRASTEVGWRLPNIKELFSIADKSKWSPAIDLTVFPNSPVEYFWSSTPYVDNPSKAMYIDFVSGQASYYARTIGFNVRLVR